MSNLLSFLVTVAGGFIFGAVIVFLLAIRRITELLREIEELVMDIVILKREAENLKEKLKEEK